MTVVSVSELKAQLSRYLREVRRGGEVQIVERGIPVARLVAGGPAHGESEADSRSRLVSNGVLRAGDGRVSELLNEPPLDLPVSILAALDEERADRL